MIVSSHLAEWTEYSCLSFFSVTSVTSVANFLAQVCSVGRGPGHLYDRAPFFDFFTDQSCEGCRSAALGFEAGFDQSRSRLRLVDRRGEFALQFLDDGLRRPGGHEDAQPGMCVISRQRLR